VSKHLAIRKRHGLQHREQRLSLVHHVGRLRLHRMPLLHQRRSRLTTSMHFQLIAHDETRDHDEQDHDGTDEPALASGHGLIQERVFAMPGDFISCKVGGTR